MRLASFLAAAGLAAACVEPTGAQDDADAFGTCADAPQRVAVMTGITFVRPGEDGTMDGFDLDGVATGQGEGGGCGVPDDVAPDGRTGIDNAVAKLLPALELTEAQAIEEIVQEAINAGNLLIALRVRGLDDPVSDGCVQVDVLRATGAPRVGAPGKINAGQTFDVEPGAPSASLGPIELVDGVLEARDFSLELPVSILDAHVEVRLRDGALRIALDPSGGMHGLFAGAVPIADLLDTAAIENVNDEVLALLTTLIGGVTDLAPDDTGTCTAISATFAFEAVEAFLFDDPPPPLDTGG
jgi:hypothetical protein